MSLPFGNARAYGPRFAVPFGSRSVWRLSSSLPFIPGAGTGSSPAPVLNALSLSNASFSEGASAGTVIGAILGLTAGSTVTVTPNDGRVAISGSNLVVGLSAASANFNITLRETLPGASNSPRDTGLTLTVNAVPALQTFSQDFVTFGGGTVPTLDAGWAYTGNDTAVAYGTGENNSSRLRVFATGARLGMDRGLQLEPAVTNLATNPRMVGAVATTFATSTVVLGSNPFTMTNGTRYFVVSHAAHGRSVGDRVYFTSATSTGGYTLFNSASTAYNICQIIDANSYLVYQFGTAASTGGTGGGTPTANYAPPASEVQPDTFSKRAFTGTLISRITAVTDGYFGTVPSSIGASREMEIIGQGTGTQYFTSAAAVQGDTLTFAQMVYGNPRVSDSFLLENTTTVSLVLDEFDSGGNFLTSHSVDLLSQLGSLIYTQARITALCTNPACASVRAGWAIDATGLRPADFRIMAFEHSISKTAWAPSIGVPASGVKASVTRPADVLYRDLEFAVAAQGAIEIEFDCKEIVQARDCIWSIGSLRLTVVGSSYPRDLELTDGTNTVTLTGAIVRECMTQQLFRVSASWGPGGLKLSCGELLGVVSGTAAGYAPGGVTQRLYLGQRADGSEKASCWLKHIAIQNNERTALAGAAKADWYRDVAKPIPNRDIAVGRQTPGNSPNIIAALGNGQIVPAGGSANGITVTGTGVVSFNSSTKIVSLGAGVTSLTLENVDMRGCALLFSMATQLTLTIRNSIFDQPLGTTGTIDITSIANVSASLIEYNDFYPGSNSAFLMHIQGLNANHTVRRNKMLGAQADFANLVGGLMEDNVIIEGYPLPFNKHADAFQCNGTSLAGLTIRNNLVDGRRRYGTGTDPNSAEIVASTNGPISFPAVSDGNIYVGFTNPIQYRGQRPTIGVGGITLWRDGATLTVQNNLLDMSTVNYLDLKMGAALTISGSTFSVSGTAATLAKIGLEAQTNVTAYTGCAFFETAISVADAITPVTAAAALSGSSTTRRLSTAFVAADAFTIGGQTFTAVASGASGNNQFNITDTLATLIGKIAAATGLSVTLGSPLLPTVTGNASLFRGIPITTY